MMTGYIIQGSRINIDLVRHSASNASTNRRRQEDANGDDKSEYEQYLHRLGGHIFDLPTMGITIISRAIWLSYPLFPHNCSQTLHNSA